MFFSQGSAANGGGALNLFSAVVSTTGTGLRRFGDIGRINSITTSKKRTFSSTVTAQQFVFVGNSSSSNNHNVAVLDENSQYSRVQQHTTATTFVENSNTGFTRSASVMSYTGAGASAATVASASSTSLFAQLGAKRASSGAASNGNQASGNNVSIVRSISTR